MQEEISDSVKKKRKKNGWTPPLERYQLVSMVVVVFMIVLMSTTILPALPENIRRPVYAIVATVEAVLLVCFIVATTTDPADSAVAKKWHDDDNGVKTEVDQYSDQYCDVCDTLVPDASPHCNKCDKCVDHYDHHCVWINNCVGSKNYKCFFAMVVATVLYGIIIIGLGVFHLASFIKTTIDREPGHDLSSDKFYLIYMQVPFWAWIVFNVICVLLATYGTKEFGFLLYFHIRLWFLNISTHEYFIKVRLENQKKREEMAKKKAMDDAEKALRDQKADEKKSKGKLCAVWCIDETLPPSSPTLVSPSASPGDVTIVEPEQRTASLETPPPI